MADFSALMAEMIARSRPQQAPPQQRPAFVGGGGVEGGIDSSSVKANVGVDLGGIIKAFQGGPSKEELERTRLEADAAYESWKVLASQEPSEELDRYELNPQFQENIQRWAKAGYPNIIEKTNVTSPTGNTAYTFIPGPPDKVKWESAMKVLIGQGKATSEQQREFGRPLSAAEYGAGLGGPEAMKNIAETQRLSATPSTEAHQQELAKIEAAGKAQRTRDRILSGEFGSELAKTLIENDRAMNKPQLDPSQVDVHKAQEKLLIQQAENLAALKDVDPDKVRAAITEMNASAELKLSEKKLIDEKVKLANDPTLAGLTPETKLILTEADRSYNDSLKQLEKAYTPVGGYKTTDYKSEYEKLSEMAELTNKHAIKTGDIVSRYRGTAANIEYFTNQVENYINTEYAAEIAKGPGGLNLGVGRIGGGAVAARKADAEAKKIDLMKKVIALHKMPGIAGTERSFAAARMYNDALKLLNPPVTGAPSALPPGLPPRPQSSAPPARLVPQPAPPAAISTTNLPAPGVAAQPQAKPSAPVVAAQGAAPGTASIYKPIGKYVIENLPRDLSAFTPAQIKKMLKDAGYSQEEIDSYFSVSSQQPPQPAPQQ